MRRDSYVKVASATDPRAQFASYTYAAQGLPLTVNSLAETSGVQPVATFTCDANGNPISGRQRSCSGSVIVGIATMSEFGKWKNRLNTICCGGNRTGTGIA